MSNRTASYWHAMDDSTIQCDLCPHGCRMQDGDTGSCGVRSVHAGQLIADGYGLVSSLAMDPIEKKPLYHFCPGDMILSVGGWGCNFHCVFCQNWTISQRMETRSRRLSPEALVGEARRSGSIGIAYTYNEPLVGYEFVADCAALAREAGLLNVLVTNGCIREEPAAALLPLIDALNVDLKSLDESFYREHCDGFLKPVQAFIKQAAAAGCHVELTNLLIPGLNDDPKGIEALGKWVAEEVGPLTPLHLSAYRPEYRSSSPATRPDSLLDAHASCRRFLQFVYLGNVLTSTGQNTCCPDCDAVLVQREGYQTEVVGLAGAACANCGCSRLNVRTG